MAVLTVGSVCDVRQNGNDPSKIDAHIVFQATDGTLRAINGDMWLLLLDPNSLTLQQQCEAAMKAEAATQLGVTFGALDVARLLAGPLGS